jgi:integrase
MLSKSITKLTSEVVQEVITRYMATTGETVAKNGKVIKRPHTAGGAHALIRRLNGLMGYATKQLKMIKGAPYSVLLPTIQEEARPILVPSQVVPFLQVIDQQENPHVHLVVRLMLGLGLREGEARRAKWSWFRLDAGIYIGHGKTKKAKARPIPGWLEGYLRALPGDHKDGLLMPSKLVKDGQPCPHGAQFTTKPIRKAGIAVGVPKLSPQGIRATYGTILNKWAGATVTETQHLLGHGEASTTLNHYIQRYVPGLEDAQERFGEVTGLTKEHQFGNGEPEYQI